jgi:hypothetical protein
MKKITSILLSGVLLLAFTAFGEPQKADQKWLEAVQQIVTKGEKKVTTPSAERANLLKEWGTKNGYALKVTKNQTAYVIEVTGKESKVALK